MTRRAWIVALAVAAAAQAGLVATCRRTEQSRREARLSVSPEPRSQAASDFTAERPDGSPSAVTARADRFQLVHFWATWCPPCREELPTLLARARRDRGRLRVWIVSTDPEWRAIRTYFGGDVPPGVVRDVGGGRRAYGVTGLPDTYLLDPNGRIVARFAGAQRWDSREMDAALERFLAGRPGVAAGPG